MTNHSKMYLLISNIRHQLATGVHTYGPCATEACTKTARGSAQCAECLTVELGKIAGRGNAEEFYWASQQVSRTVNRMEEYVDEQQDKE